jgi:hypothetical protein
VGAGTFSRGATHSPCAIFARCTLTAAIVASLALAISACGRDKSVGLGERVIPLGKSAPKGGGRYHVGKSYEIAGQRYTPHENPTYDRKGTASWYGELFHGRRTANGEIYDMDRLSAAHPTLPLPVYAHVTNLRKSVQEEPHHRSVSALGGSPGLQAPGNCARARALSAPGPLKWRRQL